MKVKSQSEVAQSLSRVRLFATPWTAAYQAPPSMEFSRQDYWSGVPFPSPGDLPDPGIKPESLMSPALAGSFFTTSATWEAPQESLLLLLLSRLSHVRRLATPWTAAYQAPPSMEFARQEYWSGVPLPSPRLY